MAYHGDCAEYSPIPGGGPADDPASLWGEVIYAGDHQVGGYTACGILLVWSANRNRNEIPVNRILLNRIPFLFISVKKILPTSINFC